ncbi:hypothetical protein FNF27_02710 [Cafeteria roenbergensis]|uniref:DNA replication licensing factor MCM7 n=2 Tax=Cafeteria roenbergensis TaxID=33653 RepID=A0A5A8C7W3_CAFRO|nr:hypothetical protein FNF29_06526 [Cafeteria roenbergensis]KAA0175628.1 hypothetical protein FNF27_02710 [Cafeteria roenbergensis]|eukprot:KAA0148744.1 hypothetical protein FNF29_06526 [Cafeteria roenbergensis]
MAAADAAPAPKAEGDYPDYDNDLRRIVDFFMDFKALPAASFDDSEPQEPVAKYRQMLEEIRKRDRTGLPVELGDMLTFTGSPDADDADAPEKDRFSYVELVRRIQSNAKRYLDVISGAADFCVEELATEAAERGEDPAGGAAGQGVAVAADGSAMVTGSDDVFDVLQRHRLQAAREAARANGAAEGAEAVAEASAFPAELRRRFEVRLLPVPDMPVRSLREVRARDIGHLVRIRAMVIRASDVKPLAKVITYTCDECGYEIYQEVTSKQFMPLGQCPSPVCKDNKLDGTLHMQTRGSKFVRYQELRVQELPDQVPVGHIPRTVTLVARGQLARELQPGDVASLAVIYTPTPYTGFRAMRAGLTADTFFEVQAVQKDKRRLDATEVLDSGTVSLIDELASDDQVYSRLARSIAPEIYGHEDVKKALLLQLVSGVTKAMSDGLRIRGDINVCLMGDPGVAKSQLLKHIAKVAPRAIYTTGKGSSGVGLTAAVLKDAVTGELTLEGGALVLADMGICCIDEFDKMDESDRTAIHEVMEQQTVSIAKAGITTTLNARTAVLAAANPLYGRFRRISRDPYQNLLRNVNLPAALLSRFDLVFLILDKVDMDNDLALAKHITYVHQNAQHPPLDFEPVEPSVLRSYVQAARVLEPAVPRSLQGFIAEAYVGMRQREAAGAAKGGGGRGVMTARQLLSILRMAQAHARLRFSAEVEEDDVREAIRLVNSSTSTLLEEDDAATQARDRDPVSRIFAILREIFAARADTDFVTTRELRERVTRAGFSEAQLQETLVQYEELGLLKQNASKTQVHFVLAD